MNNSFFFFKSWLNSNYICAPRGTVPLAPVLNTPLLVTVFYAICKHIWQWHNFIIDKLFSQYAIPLYVALLPWLCHIKNNLHRFRQILTLQRLILYAIRNIFLEINKMLQTIGRYYKMLDWWRRNDFIASSSKRKTAIAVWHIDGMY